MPAGTKKTDEGRGMVWRKAGAALLLGLTLFALVSMISFDPYDLPENQFPPNSPTHNWCGIVGAQMAGWMLYWFGAVAFVVALVGGLWGVGLLFAGEVREPWMKLAGSMLLLAAACAAGAMFPPMNQHVLSSGGAIGLYITGQWLRPYCGPIGSWMVICLAGFFGLLFLGLDRVIVREMQVVVGSARGRVAAVVLAPFRAVRGAVVRVFVAPVKSLLSRRRAKAEAATALEAATVVETPAQQEAPAVKPEPDRQPYEESDADAEAARQQAKAEARKQLELKLAELGKAKAKPRKLSKEAAGSAAEGDRADYDFPPLDLLDAPTPVDEPRREEHIHQNIELLEKTLADFDIEATVVGIDCGPVVTRYEMALAPGIKVNRVAGLADNIAMAVKAQVIRVVAPIPGKSTIGVEVPNAVKEIVRLRDLLECDEFRGRKWKVPILLGKETSGRPVISDLADMPHLLIAGSTGSGKSVCINSLITSILMMQHPDDVRLILVDPKIVELQAFDGVPHLLSPVITDVKRATWLLDWATKRMDERYDLLARAGVRHITQYNELGEEGLHAQLGEDADYETIPVHLPYIVLIIDEMADLMMQAGKDVEASVTRLAQKSRAVGIHLILATQRPSVDVITGLIKANLPTRISFKVYARVDSRTILDRNGADQLLGSGDMLFVAPGTSELIRIQGTFVSDREVRSVAQHVTRDKDAQYDLDVNNWGVDAGQDPGERDDLYDEAVGIVLESQRGSVSLLQRMLGVGYTRAARLMDMMAAQGLVGSYKGSQAREVLYTLDEWTAMHGGDKKDSEEDLPPIEAATEVEED